LSVPRLVCALLFLFTGWFRGMVEPPILGILAFLFLPTTLLLTLDPDQLPSGMQSDQTTLQIHAADNQGGKNQAAARKRHYRRGMRKGKRHTAILLGHFAMLNRHPSAIGFTISAKSCET